MAQKNWTTEIHPPVGCLIRQLQEKKGWRVKEFAQKADVGHRTIQRIRNLKEKQSFYTSDLQKIAQALETTLEELLGHCFSSEPLGKDDLSQAHAIFQHVRDMELTPLFRVYDSALLRHQLVATWEEVQRHIALGLQYEGVEGLMSVKAVEQGVPLFQILEDLPGHLSNYFLATEPVATSSVPSTCLGWTFSQNDPLLWQSLARLEHLRLFNLNAQEKDHLYTTGHDFINKDGHLERSEIDWATQKGFQLTREVDGDWWVLERIFLSPVFVYENTFSMCWSRLSTAKAYQLETRFNQGEWEVLYRGEENEFRYIPRMYEQSEILTQEKSCWRKSEMASALAVSVRSL